MNRIISIAVTTSFILTIWIFCEPDPIEAASDILLGITWSDSLLISFDPLAGQVVNVHAQLNPNEAFRGLSYDSKHNMLYALSQVSFNLYSIDPVTLDIQHIGNLRIPCSNVDIGGLTYNPFNDSFYTTLSKANSSSTDLLSVNVNNGEVINLGKISNGNCFSPTFDPADGMIYGLLLSGGGNWKSAAKASVVSINLDEMSIVKLFDTPYHSILGLAKIPDENNFYTWINWASHYYGEINLDTKNTTPLGNSNLVGIASDAMMYLDFYVGNGRVLPTEKKPVSFDYSGQVTVIKDPYNLLRNVIAVGDAFSGQFTYDIYDLYLNTHEDSPYVISLKIGNRTFYFNDFRAELENNHYNCYTGETYDFFYLNSAGWDDDFGSISLSIALTDYSCLSLTNNIFLPDRFNLSSWDKVDFYMFSSDSDELSGFSIQGVVRQIISDIDSDEDGIPDNSDKCPEDPAKAAPGICGCGIADSFSDIDGDGTLDCHDGCPADPLKTAAGACGCGVSDTDKDMDGIEDCNDDCPGDPEKIGPGLCGCGIAEIDSDGDGTSDCGDLCPVDPQKKWPGICGCGEPDVDSDEDETPDCLDMNDDNDGLPDKTEYGPGGNDPYYDGNNDGKADCLQDNVVSFHTFDDQNYLTIAAPVGTSISRLNVSENPSSDIPPSDVEFVYGFFEIIINNVNLGGAVELTLCLPAGETLDTFYKYGPTTDDEKAANHWYEFLFDGRTGAEIKANVIILHFVDGMRGDDDMIVNGKITDTGGPGIFLKAGGEGGGGGCFLQIYGQKEIH